MKGLVLPPDVFGGILVLLLPDVFGGDFPLVSTGRNGLYLPGRIGGNGVSFLVDTGSGVSILAART